MPASCYNSTTAAQLMHWSGQQNSGSQLHTVMNKIVTDCWNVIVDTQREVNEGSYWTRIISHNMQNITHHHLSNVAWCCKGSMPDWWLWGWWTGLSLAQCSTMWEPLASCSHACFCSPSSIILYWSKAGDALRLGR